MSELDKDIREEYSKHRSLFRTAQKLDVKVDYVASVVKDHKTVVAPDLTTCEFEGYGDPDKRDYMVARNLAVDSWDNTRPEVADARAKYEAGSHIMALGRDGPYLLMYLFPRAVSKPQPNFFTPRLEA